MKRRAAPQVRQRVLAVLGRMRRYGQSLSEAARYEHTTPRTVRRIVGKQLRRGPLGRYSATRGDTLQREINVLGYDGYIPVSVRSSTKAHLASEHLIAVGRFLGQIPSRQVGNTDLLKPFVGKSIGGIELLTNPDRLHELADAGLIKLDALYRNHGGRQEK